MQLRGRPEGSLRPPYFFYSAPLATDGMKSARVMNNGDCIGNGELRMAKTADCTTRPDIYSRPMRSNSYQRRWIFLSSSVGTLSSPPSQDDN